MITTPYGVSFYVKRYESRGMFKTMEIDSRDKAYQLYRQFVDSGDCYFVQMGAVSEDGAIVLNEFRQRTIDAV